MSFQVGEVDCRTVLASFEPARGGDEVGNEGCPDGSATAVSLWQADRSWEGALFEAARQDSCF